jgi:class 3 adenylate cyclase
MLRCAFDAVGVCCGFAKTLSCWTCKEASTSTHTISTQTISTQTTESTTESTNLQVLIDAMDVAITTYTIDLPNVSRVHTQNAASICYHGDLFDKSLPYADMVAFDDTMQWTQLRELLSKQSIFLLQTSNDHSNVTGPTSVSIHLSGQVATLMSSYYENGEERRRSGEGAVRWHYISTRHIAGNDMLMVETDVTDIVRYKMLFAAMADIQLGIIADVLPQNIITEITLKKLNMHNYYKPTSVFIDNGIISPSDKDVVGSFDALETFESHASRFMPNQNSKTVLHNNPVHYVRMCSKSFNDKFAVCSHDDVTILFMDVCSYTEMSDDAPPISVMRYLNTLFTQLDSLLDMHGVHKIETAGDCYIASSGILALDKQGRLYSVKSHDPKQSACKILAFAKDVMKLVEKIPMLKSNNPTQVRIGIHTGPCVSGLVGTKMMKFGVFGDTMNTASRMESTAPPGKIQVSEPSYKYMVSQNNKFVATGGVDVKGKGHLNTYIVL